MIVSLGPHVVARGLLTGVRAFVSPIATHFTTVLIASAVMLVPELPIPILGTLFAVTGLGGLIYTAWAGAHRLWRAGHLPFPDWIWNVALPNACFALILASGVAIAMSLAIGLYGIVATLLLLLSSPSETPGT